MKRCILIVFTLFSVSMQAQYDELKQHIEAFVQDHTENYEKKYLNISRPAIGDIENTDFEFADRFMLKSKERINDNLDRSVYERFYVNVYAYYDEDNLNYAVKYWLGNFIEGEAIRPGRDKRIYEYAQPTIIIINKNSIAVLHFDCSLVLEETFDIWREKMLTYFGNSKSVVVEVYCNGPLKWTKNSPDPKDRTWR